MCNYKLTVTIGKNSEIVDGGGWVTSMTWRKSTLLEAKDRAAGPNCASPSSASAVTP